VLNYTNDDPLGGHQGRYWDTFRKAVPEYDLAVVMRELNVPEMLAHGARDVYRVWMTYDELAHRPRELSVTDRETWSNDVVFVGTWMPERGPFLADLIRRGVPLAIYGGRWERAPEWPVLRKAFRGPPARGEDYAKVVQASTACLGLLSKGNRDLHTQRSLEVPALGGLLCGERTSEHLALYRDGEEAVFWSDADECAEQCLRLVAQPDLARSIAIAGQSRVRELRLGNEDMVDEVLRRVGFKDPE
jgi:hypothetical protein